jgi:hypothetical protein
MLIPGQSSQSRQITVDQAEADYFAALTFDWLDSPARRKQLKKPFGFINVEWEKLKAMIQCGDELWECSSDQESWDNLMGHHWIELRRGSQVIASLTVTEN